MDGTLEDRLAAVERAVTEGDHDCSALADGAATADRVEEVAAELEELRDRVAELEAATQALRGYVGNIRAVNSDVEERADLALSKARAARRAVDQVGPDSGHHQSVGTDEPPSHDTEPPVERCERCDRPVDDASHEGSRPDTDQTTTHPREPSRLDALGSPDQRDADVRTALASAGTDGGRAEEHDGSTDSGVLARVRALL
ncbi:hypothetical protein BRD09_00600 [Halobacteriales archaeon SW_10_68_16]|jgi:hypothetical protein|nr:MAG: hypothetical protein BRD09_00600 [Halobacteriales archaeon SW_10_68_16]